MSSGSRRECLAVLKPTGEVFVNGLAFRFDDEFPDSERLAALMTHADFSKALSSVNDALMDHWPCLPCKGFGYGCCICTLGLSLYCAATQVQEAENRVQLQLRHLNNQKKFKEKGIQWRLERTWWRRSSFLEISFDPALIAERSETSDTRCEMSVNPERNEIGCSEIMNDQVV